MTTVIILQEGHVSPRGAEILSRYFEMHVEINHQPVNSIGGEIKGNPELSEYSKATYSLQESSQNWILGEKT